MSKQSSPRKILPKPGNQPFQANRYWENRHRTFRGRSKAVGSVELTDAHNLEQCAIKRAHIVDAIHQEIPDPTGKSLLDAGCGIGLLTPAFVEAGFDVVAVDFSSTALAETKTRAGNVQFVRSSLACLEMDRTFDVITVIDVLLHITEDDEWEGTLRNLARHLAPTGIMIILEWVGTWQRDLAEHCKMRPMPRYVEALTAAGLAIHKTREFTLDHEKVTKHLLTIRHAKNSPSQLVGLHAQPFPLQATCDEVEAQA